MFLTTAVAQIAHLQRARRRITAAPLAAALAFAGVPVNAGTIYLAPAGKDSSDGLKAAKPVATLDRAVALALAQSARTGEAMTVQVARGSYRGQTLVLDGKQLVAPLTITGTSADTAQYPSFFGDSRATWLRVNAKAGRATGLTISRLRIARYATAISLNGDRNSPDTFNSGTVIRNNVFNKIGSITQTTDSPSTAAIRLVNSRDNIIAQNYFHTTRNRTAQDCSLLHPIYVAHYSSGNHITGNTFQDFCGDGIKLRDRSNDNVLEKNSFLNGGSAIAIAEWYCEESRMGECSKDDGECPSTGNIVNDNKFSGVAFYRRVVIHGGKKRYPWCSADDFSRDRFSGSDMSLLVKLFGAFR